MRAELIDGYYFVTSDNNSLLGEKDEEIMRFSKEEFESFIDNFILARVLNNTIGIQDFNHNITLSTSFDKNCKRW